MGNIFGKHCAEKEIKHVMHLKGYSDVSYPSFRKLLKKTHDLEKILQILILILILLNMII